jgi:hypothetical protein
MKMADAHHRHRLRIVGKLGPPVAPGKDPPHGADSTALAAIVGTWLPRGYEKHAQPSGAGPR